MTWLYVQKTGDLFHDGKPVARGYSGHGVCRNAPGAESMPDMGPIPSGDWRIEGPPEDTAQHGPYVLRLSPCVGTFTYGRSGFLMHGDSIQQPGTASRGCIVMPRDVRESVWSSGDRALTVFAFEPPKESLNAQKGSGNAS